ncbi:hypothetical protein ACUALS_18700 [Vibrio sp. NH-7]
MLSTKSKLLAVLEEFNITGSSLPITNVYIVSEEIYPFDSENWEMVFTDHHNADGASTIYANRQTNTLVLSYDSPECREYSGEAEYFREYLVLGNTEDFELIDQSWLLDSHEYSLWYTQEYNVDYVEFLCPDLVEQMEFED